jgi:type IV pilus assembly protein PilC
MAIFKYKAIDLNGKTHQGRIDAVNEPDLETRLGNMNMELITFQEVTRKTSYLSGRKVTRQDLITFCFHMEQLNRAGVPIIESLIDLRDSIDNPFFREILSDMVASIEGGKTFSESLEKFPRVFDEIFVSLVAAGEHSGELSTVLKNMTESLKFQDELIAQSKKLIMYPAFVGTVVLGVIFFLMIYLVPQMVSFIQSMGEALPLHTRMLIAVSDFFVHYWYVILVLPVLLFFLLRMLARTNARVRYRIDGLKLKLWMLGPILRKIILGRFATYFALLYASGVTVLESIEISERIAGNAVIARALQQVRQSTSEGQTLSTSIEAVGLFPPLVLRMLRVGESTGRLDTALLNVSYFYNREVKESIDKLQALIEPIMTVILGLILGWVMMSVLGPIYDIIGKIKA